MRNVKTPLAKKSDIANQRASDGVAAQDGDACRD